MDQRNAPAFAALWMVLGASRAMSGVSLGQFPCLLSGASVEAKCPSKMQLRLNLEFRRLNNRYLLITCRFALPVVM